VSRKLWALSSLAQDPPIFNQTPPNRKTAATVNGKAHY